MALLNFLFHHLLSCKEGIIYSQALQYNVIIPKDHILQEELNDLTRILLARAYPLYINKNKKHLIHILSNLLYQRIRHTEPDIVPIVTPFSDIRKSFTNTILKNWHAIVTDTTLQYLAIQTLICLHKIQKYHEPFGPLDTNIWFLTTEFLICYLHQHK